MVANPPKIAAEQTEASRKKAFAATERELKSRLGNPNCYGRVVLTAVIQHGHATFTIETSETMKT